MPCEAIYWKTPRPTPPLSSHSMQPSHSCSASPRPSENQGSLILVVKFNQDADEYAVITPSGDVLAWFFCDCQQPGGILVTLASLVKRFKVGLVLGFGADSTVAYILAKYVRDYFAVWCPHTTYRAVSPVIVSDTGETPPEVFASALWRYAAQLYRQNR